jgi:Zn-finger nucleic acid-binding protein
MSELVCPKCESPMRSYERSGVTIDHRQEYGGHRKPQKKRKKESFLSDLLEF